MADATERPPGLRPNQKSSKSCERLREYGQCSFGDDCYYAHSQAESDLFSQWMRAQKRQQGTDRGTPDSYFRTQICTRWREGTCRNGAACTFAHGEEFLRAPRARPAAPAGAGEEQPPAGERPRAEAVRPQPASDAGAPQHSELQHSQLRPRRQLPCRYWAERGGCRNGDQCPFAHGPRTGQLEAGGPPPGLEPAERAEWACASEKYKTQLCVYFMEQGYCRHGDRCTYAHGMHELPQHRRAAILAEPNAYRGPPSGGPEGESFDSWASATAPGSGAPPHPSGSSYGPSPAASGSLDSAAAAAVAPAASAAARRSSYNPLAAVLPAPSRASSDAVALSDDDFPPLARASSGAPPTLPTAAGLTVAATAGQGLKPAAAAAAAAAAAVAAGPAGGSQPGSGGPSTPLRASGGGAAATGPGSMVGSALASPAPSEAGRHSLSRPASAPPTAPRGAAVGVPSPLGRSSSATSIASSAREEEAAGESAQAPGPSALCEDREGRGGKSCSCPASLCGYEAGASSNVEQAHMAAGDAGPGLVPPSAPEPEGRLEHAPELMPAAATPAPDPAAAQQLPLPVSFVAPSSPRPKPEPPVAVTFSSAGSSGEFDASVAVSVASGPKFAPGMRCPPGFDNIAGASAGAAPAPVPVPLPLSPAMPSCSTAHQQRQQQQLQPGWQEGHYQVAIDGGQTSLMLAMPALLTPAYSAASVPSFICPLSKELFRDPVVAADGFTYERTAIHNWLYTQNQDISPTTKQPLVHKFLVPNYSMRTAIVDVEGIFGRMAAPVVLAPMAGHPGPCPMPCPPPPLARPAAGAAPAAALAGQQ